MFLGVEIGVFVRNAQEKKRYRQNNVKIDIVRTLGYNYE